MLLDEMYESAMANLMQEEYKQAADLFTKCLKISVTVIRKKITFKIT